MAHGTSGGNDSDIFDDDSDKDIPSPALTPPSPVLTESTAHGLYGLGILLMEIGHWTTVERMSRAKGVNGDLRVFQNRELLIQIEKLAARCGTIYQSVVRMCLDLTNWE